MSPFLSFPILLAVLTLVPVRSATVPTSADARTVEREVTGHQIQPAAFAPQASGAGTRLAGSRAECTGGSAAGYPCRDVALLSQLSPADLGGSRGNDLWGWTDPLTADEWALMGLDNGIAFVNVTDPENPVYAARLPSHENVSSIWRDVKVYANHAFVVADHATLVDHGLQIFDLTRLRTVPAIPAVFAPDSRYAGFKLAHNIAINIDSGHAYVVGTEQCGGGLLMLDLADPLVPVQVGCFSDQHDTHDAQCVNYAGPDPDHQGREICFAANEDFLSIIDVTDKSEPAVLARGISEDFHSVHQGWLTEDHRYFLLDDELDELTLGHNTRTHVVDVADLDSPVVVGSHEAAVASVDHNLYVNGEYVYESNYTSGLRVLRVEDLSAAGLREVAYLDTHPASDAKEFMGAWSNYPFFESGIVLVSDTRRGLFVLLPDLTENTVFLDGFE